MGIVYCTKNNHIFETSLLTEADDIKYAIDVTDINDVKAYPLRELQTIGEAFDVIVRYYPGYDTSDEVGWLNDLDCLVDNECDEEKLMDLTGTWGSDPKFWEEERDSLFKNLLERAIENYKAKNWIR